MVTPPTPRPPFHGENLVVFRSRCGTPRKLKKNTAKVGKTENMAMNEHERAGNPRAQWGANNLGNA